MPKKVKKHVKAPKRVKDYRALSANELLHALENAGPILETELARTCLDRASELTPGLLRFLERGAPLGRGLASARDFCQIHAAELLLILREAAAIPIWERIFRDPARGDMILDFAEDLADYGPPIKQTMLDLLYDPTVAALAKEIAIAILTDIAWHYPEERASIVRAFLALLPTLGSDGKLKSHREVTPEQIYIWSYLVEALGDLRDEGSCDLVMAMYRAKWVDMHRVGGPYRYLSKFGRYAIPPCAARREHYVTHTDYRLPLRQEPGVTKTPPAPPADYRRASADELLMALEYAGRNPSPELLRACLAKRAELTPSLLEMLAAGSDPDWDDDDPRWHREVHAGRLLIAFREQRALPIFAELYRNEESDDLLECFEWYPAEIGPAAIEMALEVLYDREAPPYGRSLCTEILTDIAMHYPAERERVLAGLRAFLPPLGASGALVIPADADDDEAETWTWVVAALGDLRDLESRPRVEALFEHELLVEDIISLEDYVKAIEGRGYPPMAATREPFDILELYATTDYNEDAGGKAAEQEDFEEDLGDLISASQKLLGEQEEYEQPPIEAAGSVLSQKGSPIKVGRNDPCPCGSGRKYKHCCGKNKQQNP